MRVTITARGTRPLLMHSARGVNKFDPLVKEKSRLTAKKTKRTEDDDIQIARLEWELGLYFDPEVGPVLPSANIIESIRMAAALTRGGKEVERGVQLLGDVDVPLLYKGPRTVDGLWGKGIGESEYVDYRATGQMKVRIMRCRPVFREWGFEVDAELDPQYIDLDVFTEYVKKAGEVIGLGDFRKIFGRFEAEITKAD